MEQENSNVTKYKRSKMPYILLFIAFLLTFFLVYKNFLIKEEIEEEEKEIENEVTMVEKLYLDRDYVFLDDEFEITDKGDEDTIGEWLEEGTFLIKLPFININSDDVIDINKQIKDNFIKFKNEIIYEDIYEDGERYLSYFTTQDYDYFVNSNILSFVLKINEYIIPSSFLPPIYVTYNIDLITGKVISNDDLIKLRNLDFDKVKEKILSSLANESIDDCEETDSDDFDNVCYHEFEVNNELVMYLNNLNQLIAVVTIEHSFIDLENKEIIID